MRFQIEQYLICNQFATTYYVTDYKTIHMGQDLVTNQFIVGLLRSTTWQLIKSSTYII